MGPPPPEFLGGKTLPYWDDQGTFPSSSIASRSYIVTGNWKGPIPIPEQSLEMRELRFSGEDRELFLDFLRRTLHWLPEKRPTAEELAYDDFLYTSTRADAVRSGAK